MQAALSMATPVLPIAPPKNSVLLASPLRLTAAHVTRGSRIKVAAVSVNYNSPNSVFPAEACEVVGGEACLADVYPEVKLQPEARINSAMNTALESPDREYMDYDGPKTVFPAEACDDLGGEFCERPYQRGVY